MDLVERTATKAEDVRFVLRSRTRLAHEELDSHPAFAAMTGGTLTLTQYAQIMRALFRVYDVLDPVIEAACARFKFDGQGFAYAPRSRVLADDLAALDAAAPRHDVRHAAAAVLSADVPPLASAASLGGMLYVVEGSVLGGAMLSRAAHDIAGKAAPGGSGYWSWCAEEGGGRWAMTCRLLTRLDASEAARDEMAGAARGTFAMIAQALQPLRRAMETSAC